MLSFERTENRTDDSRLGYGRFVNAQWDDENRFDAILEKYLAHITGEKPITARQCMKALVQVGMAKPQYIPRIKQWNQMLAETAHNAGVITNEEFAIFQNAGYMGLYGGLDVDDIHKRKNLEVGRKILNYMGSTELIANLFRISQAEEKLRKDEVDNAKTATSIHYSVGKEVRSAIEKIGGTMPEDLPTPEKSIQEIEKEQMARLKAKAKAGKLMLDEWMNLRRELCILV